MSSYPESQQQLSFDSLARKKERSEVAKPKAKVKTLAPMLRLYKEFKERYTEHILMFQVGDFYEVFFDDARTVADALQIRLTSRDKNDPNPIPMCGVPVHALDNYLPKLVQQGFSCVVASQVEDAKNAKGMVRREVTRIVTPGVRYEGDGLSGGEHNFLAAALFGVRGNGAVAFVDVSTGSMRLVEIDSLEALIETLERVSPSELVIPNTLFGSPVHKNQNWLREVKRGAKDMGTHLVMRPFEALSRSELASRVSRAVRGENDALREHTASMQLSEESRAAVQAVLDYVEEVSFDQLPGIADFLLEDSAKVVFVDSQTRRNLELFETRLEGRRKNSLIDHIDLTKTSMGARLLGEWLLAPCTEIETIEQRYDAVAEFLERSEARGELRSILTGVRDLDRMLSRITTNRAVPKDLRVFADSIAEFDRVQEVLKQSSAPLLVSLADSFDALRDIYDKLAHALEDDPPVKVSEGGIFRVEFHPKIAELRRFAREGRELILALEKRERERSGINGLKVKYNNVFGYFIEITKANLKQVPSDYERKQTLVNVERFVTQELKELELSILSSRAKLTELERDMFIELRDWVADREQRVQRTSRNLSLIDVLTAFAELAAKKNYTRPQLFDDQRLLIEDGRHPVIENIIGAHNFVANATKLNADDRRFAVLTGPNMGGKSTYLRQVGIIQLLAQMGSFVPARAAELGIVDRIFTRIGTADDITRGDSTFMVEMREVSCILKKATSRSLVLIDEIGRGTATKDGLAIATAIAEWLHDVIACRTIFATHFHELTEGRYMAEGGFCLSVGVVEEGDEISFTHRIEERSADRSYGIEVARLAGLPEALLQRASVALRELDKGAGPVQSSPVVSAPDVDREPLRKISDELRTCSPDSMTPLEALNELVKLKGMLGS